MRLQQRPYLISSALHLILITGMLFFVFRSQLITDIPIEITEILSRTAATNSVPKPEKKPEPKAPPTKPLKTDPSSTQANPQSAPASAQSNSGASNADPNAVGPIAEDYEVGEMPILLNEVRVPYPADAKSKGIQGAVVFDLVVGKDGTVADAKVISSPDASLTQAALQVIKQFKFRPAKMADKPVAIKIRYSYRFILEWEMKN